MTTAPNFLVHNGEAAGLHSIPLLSVDQWRKTIIDLVAAGGRLVSLFGCPVSQNNALRLYAIVGASGSGALAPVASDVDECYPALTPECVQAHLFEREVAEQWGVRPEGHPWLKPVRYHRSYRPRSDAWGRDPKTAIAPADTDYYQMDSEETHEVAVGPVHAGIIEPGHFRFQCHGEDVLHLEIALGYQHRGIERVLVGGPTKRTIHLMGTLAGDTTVGHSLAYCHALEALAGVQASVRAEELRGVALELERLANHTGDMGALAGDVGYLPTASFCGRLRGDFLNATALACGSRFGRGWICPGGVVFDVEDVRRSQLIERLDKAARDTAGAVGLLWNTPSVMARFQETGLVDSACCRDLGLVGVAARACGVRRDVRHEYPFGIFRFSNMPVATWHTGDVFARAYVRSIELEQSARFVRERLASLSDGPTQTRVADLAPNSFVVSLTEGWRGEICHVAMTGEDGRISFYKVVDPSFHNWTGLAMALRNQQISDFPLCNKSFNLSYCGHDL